MIQVNVELVDMNARSDIERAVSFREKPRTNMPPPPSMRDHRKSLEAAAYHDVLDLKQLLELAEKEGRVAVYGNKRNSDTSSVSSISSSISSSSSSASTSGGASPEPSSTSKRRLLPWMRRSRDFDKRSTESLSQELPMKCMVSFSRLTDTSDETETKRC